MIQEAEGDVKQINKLIAYIINAIEILEMVIRTYNMLENRNLPSRPHEQNKQQFTEVSKSNSNLRRNVPIAKTTVLWLPLSSRKAHNTLTVKKKKKLEAK